MLGKIVLQLRTDLLPTWPDTPHSSTPSIASDLDEFLEIDEMLSTTSRDAEGTDAEEVPPFSNL